MCNGTKVSVKLLDLRETRDDLRPDDCRELLTKAPGVVVVDPKNSFYVALLRQNDEDRLSGFVFNVTHTFDW